MLKFKKIYPIIRVYFNRKEDFPKVWSVDDGHQANEIMVSSIITQGLSRYVWSGVIKHSETEPRAWVEFAHARIHQINESDRVLIENSDI